MDTLQKLFEKEMMKQFTYPVVATKIVKRQLKKKGVTLTQNQLIELEKKFQNSSNYSLHFDLDLDDDQNKILGITDSEDIEIDIGDPNQELDEVFKEFIANMQDSFPEIIREMSLPLLSGLKKYAPAMLKERRGDLKKFETRLSKDWEKLFDLFEMFLVIAIETGEEFNIEFRKDKREKNNYVLEALTRLHARACQIASEILVLLKSGYADGAHARWRSLHEIAVVGSFIKTHGNDTAERYLLHDKIESFKATKIYQEYYEILKHEPMSQDEVEKIKKVYDQLITRFGNSYRHNYGWASSALEKDNPSFSDIEKNSGLDHYRPYYKLASHNVHANPKGVMFKIGLLQNTPNVLLTGPSNVGFTDPAQGATISLGSITIALLTSKPTIDNLVISNILLELVPEIGEEFFKVQKEIEKIDASQRRVQQKPKKKTKAK